MKPHEIREKTLAEVKEDLRTAQENLRNLGIRMLTVSKPSADVEEKHE